jgi:hypothetical protein
MSVIDKHEQTRGRLIEGLLVRVQSGELKAPVFGPSLLSGDCLEAGTDQVPIFQT